MNKKLTRLFWPGLWSYFLVMGGFVAAALLTRNYILAGTEALVMALLIVFYVLNREHRRKNIFNYVKTALQTDNVPGSADTPFPMALIRLGDSSVLWANERFSTITGYQPKYLEQKLGTFLPGFGIDWLAVGKNESPYDVTLGGRRYRVYGTMVRAEDTDSTVLGMIYLSDLTELYQVRDEYVRSRPVVSIILVDNYELVEHTWYGVGEINEGYARAALCQLGELHYIVVTANTEGPYQDIPTVKMFAKNIAATGWRMAYCLDGGQTAVIAMNGELINAVLFGYQRKISDIIYFATAIPEGG